MPEYVAKWIASEGVLPSMLCLGQEEEQAAEPGGKLLKRADSNISPIVGEWTHVHFSYSTFKLHKDYKS